MRSFGKTLALALAAALPFGLLADVKLPAIISDNMVLQADSKVKIWGKASPGEAVEVSFAGQDVKTTAGKDGKWSLQLAPMKANDKAEVMTVKGKNEIQVKNVLVGEVWFGSGQSNMEFRVNSSMNYEKEKAKADYPLIRCFTVAKGISSKPQDDCSGKWEICSPATVGGFSGAMYFFAKDLFEKYRFPIGLVHSSWGGSCIQAWMPEATLAAHPDYFGKVGAPADKLADMKTYLNYKQECYDLVANKDPGIAPEAADWGRPGIDTADWKSVDMPKPIEAFFGEIDGAVWFRKEIEVPEDVAGKELLARMGPTTSGMTIFFNGEKVFNLAPASRVSYPFVKIPGKLVKAGKNLFAIRYFNHIDKGGVISNNLSLFWLHGPGDKNLHLEGKWLAKVERKCEPAKLPGFLPEPKDLPGGPYNAMIAPVENFTCRGMLWYQGESNAGDLRYGKMMEALIAAWRKSFDNPDMPFYYVQLANYMQPHKEPVDTAWAKCRETQRQTLAFPNTAMAVIIDVGDALDIHPKNKQEVGRRLSLPARHFVYGEKDLEYSGPVVESVSAKDASLVVKFSHVKGGLVAKGGGEPKGFAISEDGSKYVWAKAKIEGDSVILSADSLKAPKFVRYAWDDNPDCDLYNGEGLPASPFAEKIK